MSTLGKAWQKLRPGVTVVLIQVLAVATLRFPGGIAKGTNSLMLPGKKRAVSRLNMPLRDVSQELATEIFQNFGARCPSAIAWLHMN